MWNICKIKNLKDEINTLNGHEFQTAEVYTIQDASRISWKNSDAVIQAISDGDYEIHNSTGAVSGTSSQIDWLKQNDQAPRDSEGHPVHYYPAFAAKQLEDGSKLYKRLHGMLQALTIGANTLTFVCPHSHVKMIGARIVGGEIGDYCDFKVLDDQYGSYLGTPNGLLNQYGFAVAIAKDNHEETCKYDADLYYGMQIQFTYTSVSAKTMGFNFDMSEVVPQI